MRDRLKRFVKLWVDLFDKHELLDHASAIAFQVLKALVPLTLLGLALLGAIGEERVWRRTIAPGIRPHLQQATFHAIDFAASKIFTSEGAGLIAFAGLLAIWYVSGSVRATMTALTQIYDAKDERPWWIRYGISFGLAFCIAGGVIGALLIISVG